MKSKKAEEFINGCMDHLTVEMSNHAKWQLRAAMTHATELAEQEMEEKLTRWNDPKEELPEDDVQVLCKITNEQQSFAVMKHNQFGWWLWAFHGWAGPDCEVIGWREIV